MTFCWLASYPRSGNTWLRLALASLEAGGAAVDMSAPIPFRMPWSRAVFDSVLGIDSSDLTHDECDRLKPRVLERLAHRAAAPALCKIHDAWTNTPAGEPLFPPAVTRGAVYIVRDPRDVAASFAVFRERSVDSTIALMANPDACIADATDRLGAHLRQRLGSWSMHVESWLDAPIPVLLVRYEDLLGDTGDALGRIAAFLGWMPSGDAIAAATAATRFQTLRRMESEVGFPENPVSTSPFFRQGQAGGWRDTLTAGQAQEIVASHGRVMARLGYL